MPPHWILFESESRVLVVRHGDDGVGDIIATSIVEGIRSSGVAEITLALPALHSQDLAHPANLTVEMLASDVRAGSEGVPGGAEGFRLGMETIRVEAHAAESNTESGT